MQEFTITSSQILAICGFIASLWTVYKIVIELKKPSTDMKKMVEHHSQCLDKDNKRLEAVESSQKMILQCLLVIINHDITGNGVEKMKDTMDKLQKYIIEN